jgi:hypothetical protein
MGEIVDTVHSHKKGAMNALTSLPDNATIYDSIYRLYVIEKVRKGQQGEIEGRTLTADELRNKIRTR